MGWALLPTTWFTDEYTPHLLDSHTYQLTDNCDKERHITDSNNIFFKLKTRFKTLLTTADKNLLNPLSTNDIRLPYMKLLPKVHKLCAHASPDNLHLLTRRPIITAY